MRDIKCEDDCVFFGKTNSDLYGYCGKDGDGAMVSGVVERYCPYFATERPKPTTLERAFLRALGWLIAAAYQVAWKLEDWKTNK